MLTEQRKKDLCYEYCVMMIDDYNDLVSLQMLIDNRKKKMQKKEEDFLKLYGLGHINEIFNY